MYFSETTRNELSTRNAYKIVLQVDIAYLILT